MLRMTYTDEDFINMLGDVELKQRKPIEESEADHAWIKTMWQKRRKLTGRIIKKGGPGSGNFAHAGRPGKVGGSASTNTQVDDIAPDFNFQQLGEMFHNYLNGNPMEMDEYFMTDENYATEISDRLSTLQDPKTNFILSKIGSFEDWHNYAFNPNDPEFIQQTGNLAETIGKKLNVDTDTAWKLLRVWASTSNNEKHSLSLQQAISEEFDTPLSQWQADKIKSGEARDEWKIALANRELERKMVRQVYNDTQEHFQKLGYKPDDTVLLFRGVTNQVNVTYKDVGNYMPYNENAAESWTISPNVAFGFGGAVIAKRVPVKYILSTGRTGFGVVSEGEVIVLASSNQPVKIILAD